MPSAEDSAKCSFVRPLHKSVKRAPRALICLMLCSVVGSVDMRKNSLSLWSLESFISVRKGRAWAILLQGVTLKHPVCAGFSM